ncbi:hypothetical protein H6G76_32440 [Nostoc sp. FACHB-152]|uniref:hypothetical protein n=1 Tax=unclassified Nostoc TaxID=2593658 RepID=UPI0016884187|nr:MULTISPECIES: hypothetical protein [unclassified Nostoc]MBD2451748.1 hypothetical protein [Nostoc sp. FACHB-152]MBD2472859.1 hypothetical protein [Nostoc sp. FACHB-145]
MAVSSPIPHSPPQRGLVNLFNFCKGSEILDSNRGSLNNLVSCLRSRLLLDVRLLFTF